MYVHYVCTCDIRTFVGYQAATITESPVIEFAFRTNPWKQGSKFLPLFHTVTSLCTQPDDVLRRVPCFVPTRTVDSPWLPFIARQHPVASWIDDGKWIRWLLHSLQFQASLPSPEVNYNITCQVDNAIFEPWKYWSIIIGGWSADLWNPGNVLDFLVCLKSLRNIFEFVRNSGNVWKDLYLVFVKAYFRFLKLFSYFTSCENIHWLYTVSGGNGDLWSLRNVDFLNCFWSSIFSEFWKYLKRFILAFIFVTIPFSLLPFFC